VKFLLPGDIIREGTCTANLSDSLESNANVSSLIFSLRITFCFLADMSDFQLENGYN